MNLETELLEITSDNLAEAQFMSSNFINVSLKNRVFFNVIGAEAVVSYLGKMGLEVENISSIHSIKRIVERVDVADIILDNIHIDVRVVFDETEIFIPKSHYELGLVPDIYAVLKYDRSFQRINFIGFVEPSEINLNNSSDDYYFVEPNKLKNPFDMLDFINNFKGKTDKNLSEAQILRGRELSVAVADHDVTDEEFKEFIGLLTKSSVLRNSVLEYDNFETLASKVAKALQISKEQRERDSKIVDLDSFMNMSDETSKDVPEKQNVNIAKTEEEPKDLNGDDLLDDLIDGSTKVAGATAAGAAIIAGTAAAANTLGASAVSKEAMNLAGMAGDIVVDETEKLLNEASNVISGTTDFSDEVNIETTETETVNSDDLIDETSQEVSEVTQQEDEFSDVSVEETQDFAEQDNIDELNTDIETEQPTQEESVEDIMPEDSFDDDLADFPDVDELMDSDTTVPDDKEISALDEEDLNANIVQVEDELPKEETNAAVENDTNELSASEEKNSSETDQDVSEVSDETEELADLNGFEINEDLDFSDLNFEEIQISDDLISEETPSADNADDTEVNNESAETEESTVDDAEKVSDSADSTEITDDITSAENEDISVDKTNNEEEEDYNTFDIGESFDIDDSDSVADLFGDDKEFDFDDFSQEPTGEIADDIEITEEPSDELQEDLHDEQFEETSDELHQDISDEPSEETADELSDELTAELFEEMSNDDSENSDSEETAQYPQDENIDDKENEENIEENPTTSVDDVSDTENQDLLIDDADLENFNPFEDTNEEVTDTKETTQVWDGEFTDVIEPDPEAGDDDLIITTEPKQKKDDLISLDSDSEYESIESADIGMELPVFVPPENSNADIDNTIETHDFDELPTEIIDEQQNNEEYGLVNFSDLADVPTAEPYNAEVNFTNIDDLSSFETIAPMDDNADVDYFADDMPADNLTDIKTVKENSVAISDKTHTPGEIFIDINRDSSRADIFPANEHLEELYNDNSAGNESGLNNGVRIMNEKGKSVPIILGIGGIAFVVIIAGIIMLSVSKFMNPSQNANEPPIPDNLPQNNNLGDDVPNVNMNNDRIVMNDNQPQSNVPQQPSENAGMNGASGQINPARQVPAQVQHTAKPIPATSFLSVKKLSWEVPDYVSADSNFRLYFQSAGKSLRASLSSDLLLATDYTYSNQIKVSVLYSKDGAFQRAKILLSSGSSQVDNLVLQSVNQTLKVLKAPNSLGNDQSTTVILKIYL